MSQSKTEIVRSNLPTKASDYNLANFGANTGANTGANIGANTGHIDGNNPDRRGDSRFVNSVENAFIVLETIRRAEHGLTLTRLREITGFELSMVQRHTYTLVALGYLIKDGQNGQLYRLAPRFLDLSFAALRQDDVVRIAAIHLDEFSENTPYSAWFSFLSDSELLYVLRSRGESYMKSLFAGRHAPLYSTAGGGVRFCPECPMTVREKFFSIAS
ncbi:helix-turn-helix domain-containing protein [bacterium]|nr:helix-turn-helix domain-containing protein [bacterium]